MSKVSQPELKRFLDKRITVNIQGGRKIQGKLRGFDLFLNLVVDDSVEQVQAENNPNVWTPGQRCGTVVVRGNSVVSLEGLEAIRDATRDDIPTILYFVRNISTFVLIQIQQLAIYEKALDQVEATEDSVGTENYANVLIAEVEEEGKRTPVGFSLYFYTFSTWTSAPTLFLEDLFVLPNHRNRGIGKHLFKHLGEIATSKQCARMEWNVLTWNVPSIGFYKNTLGAQMQDEWRGMRLDRAGIARLAQLV